MSSSTQSNDLRNRILFTLFILAVYRLGTFVPLPGIDPEQLQIMMEGNQKGLLGMFNVFAGGAIRSVCEVLGIQDVVAKSLGSANPHNVLKACVNGLKSQNSPKILSAIRGKKISDIILKRETK